MTHLPLEIVFHELAKILIDNGTSELRFIQEFFERLNVTSIFDNVMKPVISLVQDRLRQRIETSFDPNGLLLSLYCHKCLIRLLKDRQMAYLKEFTDYLDSLLQRRALDVFDAHIQSVKTYASHLQTHGSTTNLQDPQPHFIIRRYSQWLSSTLRIHQSLKEPIFVDR